MFEISKKIIPQKKNICALGMRVTYEDNTTEKIGNHELQMIKESDEPELLDAWVEKFWEIQKCPDCNQPLTPEAKCLGCSKNFLN